MNTSTDEILRQFREALAGCKQLYIHAAHASLEDQPDADESTRRDLVRRMVDLHKGLLIKIYSTVASADSRWSRMERDLACELVDHVWQRRLAGEELKQVAGRMFQDAGRLNWYSLVRPFDQVIRIRNLAAELETIVMRIANLVAKADGTVTTQETNAIRAIQQEVEVHLRRLSLDDGHANSSPDTEAEEASRIIHQESSLLQTAQQPASKQAGKKTSSTSQKQPQPPDAEAVEDSLEQALHDLHLLVGLDHVKKEVVTLTNYLNLQQHREAAGLPRHPLSLHMVFKGNPGTGKTTVARIVGRIFKALGLLKKGHLVETDRSGLVAEYAGQTGPKANRKIDEALDGILFIDEAYSLVATDKTDAYGQEAIGTLVKRLEDDRERLVVILAGYPGPMEQLLLSNPGLSSRFNTQMLFEDYTPVDLGRIYHRLCQANHYQVPAPARAKLLLGFHWLYGCRDEHFGNGRLVRNTFENSVRHLANRVASIAPITRELLTVLTIDDICLDKVPSDIWQQLDDDETRFAVTCESCGKTGRVRVNQLGSRVRCPHCKSRLMAEWGEPVAEC